MLNSFIKMRVGDLIESVQDYLKEDEVTLIENKVKLNDKKANLKRVEEIVKITKEYLSEKEIKFIKEEVLMRIKSNTFYINK
ncbi:hypothetical protein A0H76_2635 [Hepatospora eriocheir]|uniref:Uncharacterized protein n=1 Tax=Hepatospora eriocheir TaxID=1081669 RepID=A0A1X0QJL8_9MICR|nr:hypothetical protein A0H76_2635 [Hepatospora eriocheir]